MSKIKVACFFWDTVYTTERTLRQSFFLQSSRWRGFGLQRLRAKNKMMETIVLELFFTDDCAIVGHTLEHRAYQNADWLFAKAAMRLVLHYILGSIYPIHLISRISQNNTHIDSDCTAIAYCITKINILDKAQDTKSSLAAISQALRLVTSYACQPYRKLWSIPSFSKVSGQEGLQRSALKIKWSETYCLPALTLSTSVSPQQLLKVRSGGSASRKSTTSSKTLLPSCREV